MAEIPTETAVRLPDTGRGESARYVVLTDIDLIGAVDQVHRINQVKLGSQILTHGESGAGIGFVRNHAGLDANRAESRCVGDASAQRRLNSSGEVGEHLVAG